MSIRKQKPGETALRPAGSGVYLAGVCPSWLSRMASWRVEIAMAGADDDDHDDERDAGGAGGDYVTATESCAVKEGAALCFSLTTADHRDWRVEVDWETLEAIAGQPGATGAEVERALMRSAHHLEFAALRLIAKGVVDGDRVFLTVDSLGI